jgi:hypothetical protein
MGIKILLEEDKILMKMISSIPQQAGVATARRARSPNKQTASCTHQQQSEISLWWTGTPASKHGTGCADFHSIPKAGSVYTAIPSSRGPARDNY